MVKFLWASTSSKCHSDPTLLHVGNNPLLQIPIANPHPGLMASLSPRSVAIAGGLLGIWTDW